MTTPSRPAPQNANSSLRVSARGISYIRQWEREVPHLYDSDGGHNCSYGIGTLVHRGPCTAHDVQTIHVTPRLIQQSFFHRLEQAAQVVREALPNRRLTQDQFDALVSFTYNTGIGAENRIFTLLNDGQPAHAVIQMQHYVYARDGHTHRLTRLHGLARRRVHETRPFLGHDGARR